MDTGEQLHASWAQARVWLPLLWPWLEPNPAPPRAGPSASDTRGARADLGARKSQQRSGNTGWAARSGMKEDRDSLPASLTLSCSCWMGLGRGQQPFPPAMGYEWYVWSGGNTSDFCPQLVAVPDLPVTAAGGPACLAGTLWDLCCPLLWSLGSTVLQGPERTLVWDRGK